MTTIFSGTLLADYNQFYLAAADSHTDYSDQVDDTAIDDCLLCQDDVAVVFTARNMDVPVSVELHETEPALALAAADHVVQGGLRSAGQLVIAGCTDYLPDAARLTVPAGPLRIRVLISGLDTLSEDGLDGDDRYVVQLWPGAAAPVQVLKRWPQD